MNIRDFYEEKERKEKEKAESGLAEKSPVENSAAIPRTETAGDLVIPVVSEQAHIHTEEVETGKVRVQKKVVEVEKSIEVPLKHDGYEVKRVPIGELINEHPAVREEGDRIIVPVVEEVLVVQKRLRLVEEVHLIKQQTTVTKTESFIVKKEEVTVERVPTDNKNSR